MAIQTNRRKRKHEGAAEDQKDDAEIAVPKKVAKESQTPKKKKTKGENTKAGKTEGEEENYQEPMEQADAEEQSATPDNEDNKTEEAASPTKKRKPRHEKKKQEGNVEEADISPDSGIEPEEKPQWFPNDFKMMHFRTKLQGNSFITELRHFLYMCKSRPKIVAKYIEKRGKPLELAEAFNRIDKTNVLHVGYLCEALQRIIMEILTNQKNHMESAAHAGRYFLKTHGSVLDQLLQSAQPNHRRNALKLLTAIVCVDPQLGRQVLSSYDILSNVRTMENMLSHSKNDYTNEETVRKAYIHFILAFLVDDNTLLIRNILDRAHLIRVLAKGLVFDDHVTVCVVVNALRQYVLENVNIQKTKKVHVFDLECCKHFSHLYEWQGPQGLVQRYSKRKQPIEDKNFEPENRETVAEAAHKFLVTLLTSRKHGISFDAMTNYRQKHNKLQGKLMGSLYRPFADERKVELILRILQACPDLGRHSARNFSNYVSPMRMSSTDLPKGLDMLSKVIAAVPPSSLSTAMDKMTLTDFGYWIKELCLPAEALIQIVSKNLLRHDDFSVRLAVNRLLLSMMTQYSNYVNAIALREQSKRAGNSLRRFKFELLNHLLVNFPPMESILYSLYKSIQEKADPNVNVLEQLSVTLELVLMMCKENRAFVNKTSQILDYLDVLRPLYETNFDEPIDTTNPGGMDKVQKIKLELKSIKTILLLFPRSLHPQEKLFEKVLRSFIKAYMLEDVEVKTEAGELLHSLFQNTGMFDSSSFEIDIWLEALIGFNAETVDNVTSILLTLLSLDLSQVKELPVLNARETATNVENLRKLFTQIEKGQTVQAYVETLTLSKMMPLLLQGVTIEAPYDAYVELVMVLLYQFHAKPTQVQQLYSSQLEQHTTYMQNWQDGKPSQLPAAIGKHWTQLDALQRTVLKHPTQSFEQIFKPAAEDTDRFELKLEDGNSMQLHHTLRNPRRNTIYAHNLLFLLSQLVASEQLNTEQSQLICDSLIKLLQIATQVDDSQQQRLELLKDEDNQQQQREQETHTERLLQYIYGMRLSQLHTTQLLSETSDTLLHYVTFLRRLTEHCRTLPKFSSYTSYYRQQLVIALEIALDNAAADGEQSMQQPAQLMEWVPLVDSFELSATECAQMLQLLTSKLQAGDYFNTSNKTNHYYELLLRLLRRLAQLQEPVDCSQSVLKLQAYYRNFCENALAEQLEHLESALLQFLIGQHHHLATCDAQFFECFFSTTNRKLSKSAVNLASLLLQRNAKLASTFAHLLPTHLEQKELIYPLLDVAFSRGYKLEQSLLQRCYQTYKNGILKSIEKPLKAAVIYRDHPEASAALIAQCMPKSECLDYCQKQLKFDAVENFQMRVLREIYWQAFAASKDEKQQASIVVSYVNLSVQMLALDLKKQSVQLDKLEQLAFNCYDWWQQQPETLADQLDWSRLLKAPHWLNYCRSCLKQAMHMAEEQQKQSTPEQDQVNGLLLKLLAFLCDRLYVDYSEEADGQSNEDAALLYEMVCTHSCCYDHLLGESSAVKTHLLQLLETLARKAPAALHAAHIPVILGAYHAKLTPADRYALALLEHYERFDVGLAQYRPFIWGESAVAHYALRATDDDERAKLQQQETNVAQVLALIVRPGCQYTIENFPIWRSLHASQQLPELQFLNPCRKSQNFGDNSLEQQIESGASEFTQDVRRLCPKRDELYEQCYDPAFMLPLMMHCFAPESVVRAQWPVQNGLLALSFCALSSLDKDMRLAAACCQQRYRSHFELSKFYEKPLWTQAYDNIQGGLNELRTAWLAQRRAHGGTPRVPLIPALFIANSFNLSTDPTHLLYKRLMMYLQLKQSFNFQTIPEFNVFFYSPEPEHQQYREFIVQLLSNGIKCSADLFLLVSTNTFKVLLSFYCSNLANLDTNLLLLSVLSTCVKIPGAVKIMLEHVGILSWLAGVIRDTQFHQFDIIEGIISIINNLWYAVAASQSELPDYAHIQLRLHRLVVQLLPLISPRVSIPGLARLLNVLQKTATRSGQYLALSAQQLDLLLDCAARHWPQQLASIRYLRSFGGTYASPRAEFCDWLAKEQQLDTHTVLALSSLREYVTHWWQVHKEADADAKKDQKQVAEETAA
ncbi:nucleolar pre-ribosomal-associated protein 1 [Drosophila albomicans]|uniref:Nucleolar pre-ribosomal-associated protein 1 n=1 Tax=Drosophila albomicans TaxID=7291 RepID=A0A6P8ZF84_DROAB|nr:nucleolar pre-ribosomal-associated protein 1 [Drosophila albomicans]